MMYLVVNSHVLKAVWEDLSPRDTSSDVNRADLKESLSILGPLGFMGSIINTLRKTYICIGRARTVSPSGQ